jgi:DtxR family transcriptional regulator, Mn-dependent transcriptional regulator
MSSQAVEMYIGGIFRLRETPSDPVSLRQIQHYFQFSPISIHEMITKLESLALLTYQPYKGVILTDEGEKIAASLIRRHRIWERFLVDTLSFLPGEVHNIADQLEHAASEEVTNRLSNFLGDPESCPHGSIIPPFTPTKIK